MIRGTFSLPTRKKELAVSESLQLNRRLMRQLTAIMLDWLQRNPLRPMGLIIGKSLPQMNTILIILSCATNLGRNP